MNVKPSKTSSLLLALFVLLFVQTSLAQETSAEKNANVKGVVNSDKDQPLEGVSVIIRNTRDNFTLGTSTNGAGAFSFARVPAGGPYSFVFSAVGYESQTLTGYVIKDGASLSLLIKLKDSSNVLDQVVVVGYGTQKRKDVTGAISSIKSQDIADMAVTRIDQALVGKAAGVLVKPSTGEPGASPQIRIRGIGSISAGASPLYVIDGFPTGNIETLNPNDIESVDILKDASATAIYGSRGSNGVVIINTKRGKAGKTVVSLDSYYGWQKAERKPKMMNAKQQAQYFYDGVRNRNLDEGNDVSGDPALWKRPVPGIITDVLAGRNTYDQDALDAVLITAPTSQFQLTVTGGNANTKYLLSGEYLNQDGVVLNSHFTRYSMRANFDTKLFPKLTL
jgi:TonB-linked SusC/RagA family outer membrane protein